MTQQHNSWTFVSLRVRVGVRVRVRVRIRVRVRVNVRVKVRVRRVGIRARPEGDMRIAALTVPSGYLA